MLENTVLFQRLEACCGKCEAGGLDLTRLPTMVKDSTDELGNVLDRAVKTFDDYTLHDRAHAVRVVKLMSNLLGPDRLDALTPVDLAVLILAAYAHDTGMAASKERRDELKASPEYAEFMLRHESEWVEVERVRAGDDPARAAFLESRLFQEFLRSRHHLLSAELVRKHFASGMTVQEKSFAPMVADLCRSHGESVAWVARELQSVPFAMDYNVDLPFLACVLRLADFLDLDATRAPESLMTLIKRGNERSHREWRKHQASLFSVSDTAIRFNATFEDFFEEKVLRDTLDAIEVERKEIMGFLGAGVGEGAAWGWICLSSVKSSPLATST